MLCASVKTLNIEMSPRFSSEDDDILIFEIRKHGTLYNLNHADYKDVNMKERIWIEISQFVEKNGK